MRVKATVQCSKCQKPILSGEGFVFVSFEIPGQKGYRFFHCQLGAADCWRTYLKEGKS